MSADSQSHEKGTALSQLWNYCAAPVAENLPTFSGINSAMGDATSPSFGDCSGIGNGIGNGAADLGAQLTYNHNNNNNNHYVNFDQFIMQHNFLGDLMGGNSSIGVTSTVPANAPVAEQDFGNNFTFTSNTNGDNFFNVSQANVGHQISNGLDNNYHDTNPFMSNSNFDYGNGSANSLYANGLSGYNTTNTHYFDNIYTPFGNSSTNPFANPFAAAFDFSKSNLQATAAEFVPRFSNLSLNENNANPPQKQTNQTNDSIAAIAAENVAPTSTFSPKDFLPHALIGSSAEPEAVTSSNSYSTAVSAESVDLASKSLSTPSTPQALSTPVAAVANNTGAVSKNLSFESAQETKPDKIEKSNSSTSARTQREIERDNRRYQNGRRSVDFHEREDRYERYERGERGAHRSARDRDYHQRFDNHRSNKRRDDWNRNRDRINGFRVEEKFSIDNKDSPVPSPEKKNSPKKVYPENEKLSQREKLIRDIETRRLECPVCVEAIKSHQSVWSCNNCYHIFHLQCITKWATSSIEVNGWRCPACQNVVREVPRDYYCFCGKVKNPLFNRQEIAHSCGEICGRIEGCIHACSLLCHPGPCPPCQANVKRECGCGKTTRIMQCCLKDVIECDAICGKLLNCEIHTCSVKCHEGKCAPCTAKVDQTCHCSKQERQVVCTRDSHDKRTYSCGKPCGKDLSCGNHKCKDCCHGGECRTCKLSPELVTSCPCGKMPVVSGQRNSCLDAIPVCDGVCGKTLRCGKSTNPHHCTSKCHLGNCPPCNKQTAVKCRCGHMDQMIKCRQLSTRTDDARCKKRCVKKRSCGKHKCNQECCIDIDHICPLPCNYTLPCGKHKCDLPCHRGNCPPCYRSSFDELFCECGAEVIYPPVPCGTKRPACKRPCSRTHICNHPPQHNCHSAATCPPCMIFTTKWCFGQHEQRKTIPCSQKSFSCGLPCNKPLPCGRHKCIKPCHEGPCQISGEICKQSCTTARPSCGHKCLAPCHDGECPETPCKEQVEVQCECGNRKQMRSCHDLAREYSRIATAQLASSMAEMQRGNYMELSEILAPVKNHKTNKTLDCNEECRLLERNRRLAIGLQIRNPDLSQKLATKYSDFIRNFAKRDPVLVKSTYDTLTNLVKLAKESKQKSRSHSFPIMNREKRQLVHELCEAFGVESIAYDKEPNRNVVATAYKDKSWLPATSIMEIMQRESGQRRVPVPSNNAWGIKR